LKEYLHHLTSGKKIVHLYLTTAGNVSVTTNIIVLFPPKTT
jgi:hypothetical protein